MVENQEILDDEPVTEAEKLTLFSKAFKSICDTAYETLVMVESGNQSASDGHRLMAKPDSHMYLPSKVH